MSTTSRTAAAAGPSPAAELTTGSLATGSLITGSARAAATEACSIEAVLVCAMERRHLREVCRIDRLVYPRPWSMAIYLDELQRDADRVYRVACRAGPIGRPASVIGYGGLMIVGDEGHITSVAVHPQCQSRGVGAQLLLELHREARRIGRVDALTLEVRASNAPAQRLYRWFGYAPVGTRKDYYRGTEAGRGREDALVMWSHDIDGSEHSDRLDGIATALGVSESASDSALGVSESASDSALGVSESASDSALGVSHTSASPERRER